MNIAVLGLGYVGCISSACLAQLGHRVIGVDVNQQKVDLINQGKSPIVEAEVDDMINEMVSCGRLEATTDATSAVMQSDISLICVGTPSQENGSLDLQYVQNAAKDIGRALRNHQGYHVVAIRSTMLPGSIESNVIPMLEAESGRQVGENLGVCINPEFLREGTAVRDYYHPPFTLVGSSDPKSSEHVIKIYEAIDAPVFQTTLRAAEMVKYVSNAFHALKVSFANEIGIMCKMLGIDSHEVMDIVVQDKVLNISPKYLKPGFAFGGSCLPKDVRALVHRAKSLDLELPVLAGILPSNQLHIEHAFQMIQRENSKKIGVLGLSFKPGTDDLRESPLVSLVEKLIGKGYQLRIYDKNVSLARILGANKRYIEHVIPHISSLLVTDLDEIIDFSEIIVLGNNSEEFRPVLRQLKPEQKVIDLVGLRADAAKLNGNYQGICW